MSTSVPGLDNLLAQWWGTDPECFAFAASVASAANVVYGTNPLFQISDFLAIYPKFGTYAQSIDTFSIANGGSGYAINDTVTVVQPDASQGTLTVDTVDGSGKILTAHLTSPGTGYSVANTLPTTTSGSGTGAIVNVLTLTPANLNVPTLVIQLYINLASASLVQARWLEYWPMAMANFVAHFLTLYLRSEGNVGSSAAQIATSGLQRGIQVSKSVGGVSVSIESPTGLDGFGVWNQTTYGSQLAQWAKIIGMGPAYIL